MSLMEEWRPVPGLENHYKVSDLGRVMRTASTQHTREGRIVKAYPCPVGLQVHLTRMARLREGERVLRVQVGQHWLVHRLVYSVFVAPVGRRTFVMPKNGDRYDPRLSNLTAVEAGRFRRKTEEGAA